LKVFGLSRRKRSRAVKAPRRARSWLVIFLMHEQAIAVRNARKCMQLR